MINHIKYRKLSLYAFVALIIALLLNLGTLWNALLSPHFNHAGWLIFFLLLFFICGAFLFFLAYRTTDHVAMEKLRKDAYESGKSEIMQQIEQKKQEESGDQYDEKEELEKRKNVVFSGLRGNFSESSLCNKVLSNLARELEFVQGVVYLKNDDGLYNPVGEYALTDREPTPFKAGENLNGQTAVNKSTMIIYDIPENYFVISSGLGSSMPRFLLIVPVLFHDDCIAVVELASFKKPDTLTVKILDEVSAELGNRLNKHADA
jgi:hypothetical protein